MAPTDLNDKLTNNMVFTVTPNFGYGIRVVLNVTQTTTIKILRL